MARKAARPPPARERTLEPVTADCPGCGRRMRVDDYARRTVAALGGLVGLRVQVRRCHDRACPRFHQPYRPEEGRAVRGYCAAVRTATTGDGRPPLDASGLKRHGRLTAIHRSLGRAGRAAGRAGRGKKGRPQSRSARHLTQLL